MVKTTSLPIGEQGDIDIARWLETLCETRKPEHVELIRRACELSKNIDGNHPETHLSFLQMGMEMADILNHLQLDHETLSAAILYNQVLYQQLSNEKIEKLLNPWVSNLIIGTERMDAIRSLQKNIQAEDHHEQIDNLRKMLLSMVDDARVVLIKLAERVIFLRHFKQAPAEQQQRYAKEAMNIYAPLANRLGVSDIKWELEDLSFRYLQPDEYKQIATLIKGRRLERQAYVDAFIQSLKTHLSEAHIENAEVSGRAKHIFSIYRKMHRKSVSFDEIYDAIAVRILLPEVMDCYKALSMIHSEWPQIPKEFDDYIAKPKPNGYRSIHTAVVGPANKNVEVQIRTYAMHEESELGVAAHWRYKEGGQQSQQAGKAAWLRQLLEWQKELVSKQEIAEELELQAFEDRVYVFTPNGEVVDLPPKATPIDFAYQIHSEVGHRCRGAKVNGHIVPLTYQLNTGDKIEIITAREPAPSRDWLNPQLGYTTTARARAKIQHWFRQKDYVSNLELGKELLERELKRLNIHQLDLHPLLERFNFKKTDDLIAALGNGDVKLSQIVNYSQQSAQKAETPPPTLIQPSLLKTTKQPRSDITIQGVGNLLTQIAKCCKPIPGDPILGYITQGRGVTIHHQHCPNLQRLLEEKSERLIEVHWGQQTKSVYQVDIQIEAHDRTNLIRDISNVIAHEKLNLTGVRSYSNTQLNRAYITISLELTALDHLNALLHKIQQLPSIISAKRLLQP